MEEAYSLSRGQASGLAHVEGPVELLPENGGPWAQRWHPPPPALCHVQEGRGVLVLPVRCQGLLLQGLTLVAPTGQKEVEIWHNQNLWEAVIAIMRGMSTVINAYLEK